MLPITLDLSKLRIALVGEGAQTLGRLESLDEAQAAHVAIFAPEPSQTLEAQAGARLRRTWPGEADWPLLDILFAGDLPPERAKNFYRAARDAKVLVNVEDQTDFCDFHMPAILRRGALSIAVSTAGRAPGLSGQIRRSLGQIFGPEWANRLEDLSKHRAAWRAEGLGQKALQSRVAAYVRGAGWLPDLQPEETPHDTSR